MKENKEEWPVETTGSVPDTAREEKTTDADKKKEKEPLSEEDRIRRRKIVVIPVFILLFLAVMYLIFVPTGNDSSPDNRRDGFNINVPEPENTALVADKKDAYEKEQIHLEEDKRQNSLRRLSENLLGKSSGDTPKAASPMEESVEIYEGLEQQLDQFYESPENVPEKDLKEKVDELSSRLAENETLRQRMEDREKMMENSYRMAAKYLNPNGTTDHSGRTEETDTHALPVSKNEISATSGLSGDLSDSVFLVSLAVPRNYGFNTAVGTGYRTASNTISACISETQTVEPGGRVRLRLLEGMRAGNLTIPENSLVTGTVFLQGERMDIVVSSIEYGGNILPVQLTVFDVDGQKGIFVPGSESRNTAKESLANVGESMGNSISFARSAGQQIAMDVSRGVIQGGTQLIGKKIRAVRITLKAGYKVLLVAKES